MVAPLVGILARGALSLAFRGAAWGVRHPVLATGTTLGAGAVADAVTDGASTEKLLKPVGEGIGGLAGNVAGGLVDAGLGAVGSTVKGVLNGTGLGAAMGNNGLWAAIPAIAGLQLFNGVNPMRIAVMAAILTFAIKLAEDHGIKLPGIKLDGLTGDFNRAVLDVKREELAPKAPALDAKPAPEAAPDTGPAFTPWNAM